MLIETSGRILRWICPKAIWRMDKHEHAVYLTFDDGPIPRSTPFILDTLKKYGVKATFFMVGENVHNYPELMQRILEEGHQVGNHTYNHWSSVRHRPIPYLKNIDKAAELIPGRLFRPPHGWIRQGNFIWTQRRYKFIMWDVITRDYSYNLTAEDVLDNVKRYTRNGSIITFHDSIRSIDKLRTALPAAIEWLRDQGYEFKTIPDADEL